MEKYQKFAAATALVGTLATGGCGKTSMDEAVERKKIEDVAIQSRLAAYMALCEKLGPTEKSHCEINARFQSLPLKK